MPELILVFLAVFAFWGGLRAFERASVASVVTFLTWLAILGGLSLMLLLVLTGREGFAIAIAALIGPFLWERWRASHHGPEGAPAGPGHAGKPPDDGAMTREEAWRVLGLAPGADAAQIKQAHRRLIRAAHPDAGGSDRQAARVNRARDLLLGHVRR